MLQIPEIFKVIPIALIWTIFWTVFRYFRDNKKQNASSDYKGLIDINHKIDDLKKADSFTKEAAIRNITFLNGFSFDEFLYLRDKKVFQKDLYNLRAVKWNTFYCLFKTKFLSIEDGYQHNFPAREKLKTTVIKLTVIFLVYILLLMVIMFKCSFGSSLDSFYSNKEYEYYIYGQLLILFFVGIVQVPYMMNLNKIFSFKSLYENTDLFFSKANTGNTPMSHAQSCCFFRGGYNAERRGDAQAYSVGVSGVC